MTTHPQRLAMIRRILRATQRAEIAEIKREITEQHYRVQVAENRLEKQYTPK